MAFQDPLADDAFRRYTPENLDYLKRVGFDFVRIPFDPSSILAQPPGSSDEQRLLGHLLAAVDAALDRKLKVVLDSHVRIDQSTWSAGVLLADFPDGLKWRRYKDFLQTIGSRLLPYDPTAIAFQQFNEMPGEQDRFNDKVLDLYNAFRSRNSSHTVIIGGNQYSSIEGVEPWKLSGFEGNFIVAVTPYLPQQFTHQGVPDSKFYAGYYRLSWPPSLEERPSIETKIKAYPSCERIRSKRCYTSPVVQEEALTFIDDYFRIPKDDRWLADQLEQFVAFRERNGLGNDQLMVTEFGSHGDFGTAGGSTDNRANWMQAIRTMIEKRGWAWAVWHWDNNVFGIGFPEIRPEFVKALGLREVGSVRSSHN